MSILSTWVCALASSSVLESTILARIGSEVRRSATAPRTVTPFTSFDFGDVYTGETISQIFVIRNEGDAELQIKEFKGG